jgi:HK97 gp10 family phage protein
MKIRMNLDIADVLASLEDATEIMPELNIAVRDTAFNIERSAKLAAPVDTGRLRGSITTDFKPSETNPEAEVGTNVEYADYVEYGTYKMAAKPYLNPAYDKHIEKFENQVSRIIRRLL